MGGGRYADSTRPGNVAKKRLKQHLEKCKITRRAYTEDKNKDLTRENLRLGGETVMKSASGVNLGLELRAGESQGRYDNTEWKRGEDPGRGMKIQRTLPQVRG